MDFMPIYRKAGWKNKSKIMMVMQNGRPGTGYNGSFNSPYNTVNVTQKLKWLGNDYQK